MCGGWLLKCVPRRGGGVGGRVGGAGGWVNMHARLRVYVCAYGLNNVGRLGCLVAERSTGYVRPIHLPSPSTVTATPPRRTCRSGHSEYKL